MTRPRRETRRSGRTRGRIADGREKDGLPMADRVIRRVDGVEIPVVPWTQRDLTEREAAAEGLLTHEQIGDRLGYAVGSITRWARTNPTFPQPRARLASRGGARLYNPAEIAAWYTAALRAGHIRSRRSPSRED